MKTTNTAQEVTARLAALLVEINTHAQKADILQDAAQQAHNEIGCTATHEGDLVTLIALLGRHAADAAEADAVELCGFYEDEARFPQSDHEPKECRRFSSQYGEASAAYERAGITFTNLANALDDDLRASNI
jgi:hypothetical protein